MILNMDAWYTVPLELVYTGLCWSNQGGDSYVYLCNVFTVFTADGRMKNIVRGRNQDKHNIIS